MPYALVVIGLMLIVSGAKNTYQQLGQQIVTDFTGDKNFSYWIVSIGAVGAVGYNKTLQPLSRSFLFLILISFIIKNNGVFTQFTNAMQDGPKKINSSNSNTNMQTGFVDNSADIVNSVGETARTSIEADTQRQAMNKDAFFKLADIAMTLAG